MTAKKPLSRRYVDAMSRCHKKFGKVPPALTSLLFKFPPEDIVGIFEILLDEAPEVAATLAEDQDDQDEPAPLAHEGPKLPSSIYVVDGREVQ